MSTSLANTLFAPVVPDWPAGSRPAPQEPGPDESFDSHLQPASAEEATPREAGSSKPDSKAAPVPPSAIPEAQSEEDAAEEAASAGDENQPREPEDTPHERIDLDLSSQVMQALSGAAAINVAALEPAAAASSEDLPAVEVDVPRVPDIVDSVEPAASAPTVPVAAAAVALALPPIDEPVVSGESSHDASITDPSAVLIAAVPAENAASSRPLDNKSRTVDQLVEEEADVASVELPIVERHVVDSRTPVEIRSEPDRLQIANPPVAETVRTAARPEESTPVLASPGVFETAAAGVSIPSVTSTEAPQRPMSAEVFAPDRPSTGSVPAREMQIDSARLLHRVARAFAAAAERQGEVTIRLSPPELGSLRLEARVEDGVLTARLHAETPDAQRAILENLPALRERLADQGVRIERFDVDLMNRQPGQSPHEPFDHQRETPRLARSATGNRPADPPAAQNSPRTIQAAPGRLNVIV